MNISKNVNSSMAHFKSICFFVNFSMKIKLTIGQRLVFFYRLCKRKSFKEAKFYYYFSSSLGCHNKNNPQQQYLSAFLLFTPRCIYERNIKESGDYAWSDAYIFKFSTVYVCDNKTNQL